MGIGTFVKRLASEIVADVATDNGHKVAKKIASIERDLDDNGGTCSLALPIGYDKSPLVHLWWPIFVYLDVRGYATEETKDVPPDGHIMITRITRPPRQENT